MDSNDYEEKLNVVKVPEYSIIAWVYGKKHFNKSKSATLLLSGFYS